MHHLKNIFLSCFVLVGLSISSPGFSQSLPECMSAVSDSDNDGYGWENNQSCIVVSQQQGQCEDRGDYPWGWNPVARESCRLDTTTLSNNIVTQTCVDTDPLNDGWGWNGSTSCRIAVMADVDRCDDVGTYPWGWNPTTNMSCRLDLTNTPSVNNISDIDYFKEVALTTEFGAQTNKIRKWQQNIHYFVTGEVTPLLENEVSRVAGEVNALIDIQFVEVFSRDEANFLVFFGSADEYVNSYEPNARDFVNDFGLFWGYWNGNYELFRASMHVNSDVISDPVLLRHLVREEFTQSLGFFNDSFSYPDSIFYQGFSSTTEFAPIDIEVIRFLYSDNITAGMTGDDIDRVLRSGLN